VAAAVRTVGHYELLRIIGRGGMATVYLARQTDLDRQVALKELKVLAESDPQLARRFLHEARLAGSFSHPNIVTVHEYLEHGGTPYIAMEYLPRGSLRPYVGRMSLAQIGGTLVGVLDGLAHAEERRIVHRDLKPENIMVSSQGWAKIADFGIAKATSATQTEANLTTTGTTLGTPRYMAPERAMGQEIGPWSDLYSLGVIVFELLAGRTPFHDTDAPMAILMRQINEPIPPVGSLVPDVDPALSDWAGRLLEKDPARRTRSASVARQELDEILIDQLGSRWLREAGLPARPGAPAATLAGMPKRPPRAASNAATAGDSAAAAAPTTARAVNALPADPETPRTVPVAGDHEFDATVAPATLRANRGRVPQARGRRFPRAARTGLVVVAALASVAVAATRGGGDPARPRETAPTQTRAFEGLRQRTSAHADDLAGASTPDTRRRAALALARDYDGTAGVLERDAPGAAETQLAAQLHLTARAYRDAAAAARRADEAAYRSALSDAQEAGRAVDDALRAPAAPSPRASPGDSGVGDSRSDDPSDDEPDENED
jgi:tRNA A-37 threonylcarbamoyl transferase component Bud32